MESPEIAELDVRAKRRMFRPALSRATGAIGFDVGTEGLSACWRLLLRLIKLDVIRANDNALALAA
jgi:hypothetical protein